MKLQHEITLDLLGLSCGHHRRAILSGYRLTREIVFGRQAWGRSKILRDFFLRMLLHANPVAEPASMTRS